jgi:hypothetical protein
VVCAVSHASILALSPHLVPLKGTGWPFGRWICSLIQEARPDWMYLLAVVHERRQCPSARQKVHVSARGPKRRNMEAALVLGEGVVGAGIGAVAGALHGCGGGGDGAGAW